MASPTASPTTNRKIPAASSTPVPGASSKAAATTNVANRSLKEPTPSGAPLEGAPAYDFNLNLNAAYLLLQENKPEEARRLFEEIQTQLKGTRVRKDSLNPIHCSLGLALTYPEGNPERSKHAVEVYDAIKIVWATKVLWNNLTPEKKSEAYCALRHCLKRFQPLIPHDQHLVRREMAEKIAECSKHILPLEIFYEKVQEAARHVQKKELEEACERYTEALQFIEGKTEPCYLIGRVDCLLGFAKIYDEADKNELSQRAKTAVFQLYDARASVTVDGSKKIEFLILINQYLADLSTLFPDTSSADYLEIQARIEACKKELPADYAASSQLSPKSDKPAAAASSAGALPAHGSSETAHGGKPPSIPAASSSGAPLPDPRTAPKTFSQALSAAYQLLGQNKIEAARSRFEEIQSHLKTASLSKASLIPVHVYLGLAYTSSEGSSERTTFVGEAYDALKIVLAHTVDWESLNPEEKSNRYVSLRMCLKKVLALVLKEMTGPTIFLDADQIKIELIAHIEACAKYILPLDDCKEKISEADQCVRQKDLLSAAKLYKEALQIIDGKDTLNYLIPRADCLLSYVKICDDPSEKKALSLKAKDAILEIYTSRQALCASNSYKITNVLQWIINSLNDLSKLFPDGSAEYLEAMHGIETCQQKLREEAADSSLLPTNNRGLTGKAPSGKDSSGPSETAGGKPPRKVTPGSPDNGSWRIGRIFAVLVLAALAITGVVFYRRHIVKID